MVLDQEWRADERSLKACQNIAHHSATNATSERSFSTLRRVKSYLCSNRKQSRLIRFEPSNHLQYIYLDQLDLKAIANYFVDGKENRMNKFKLTVSVTVAVAYQRAVHLRMRKCYIPRPLIIFHNLTQIPSTALPRCARC